MKAVACDAFTLCQGHLELFDPVHELIKPECGPGLFTNAHYFCNFTVLQLGPLFFFFFLRYAYLVFFLLEKLCAETKCKNRIKNISA